MVTNMTISSLLISRISPVAKKGCNGWRCFPYSGLGKQWDSGESCDSYFYCARDRALKPADEKHRTSPREREGKGGIMHHGTSDETTYRW